MLTQQRLKEVLRYDRKTGAFFWRATGKRAGYLQNDTGYQAIGIDGQRYKEHRLAWLYVYGHFPDGDLDHKNRNKADNRITNLREATQGQNNANAESRQSRSGLKGAYWHSRNKRWFSFIRRNGKIIYLGGFVTAEEAHAAYCKAATELHGEFFHTGNA